MIPLIGKSSFRFRTPDSTSLRRASRKWIALAALLMTCAQPANAGGWYVGNTASTEWVRYKRVYFSAGTYRFTARAGSPASGSTMHLEIDNVTVSSGISVPNTGRADSFDNVHLGSKTLTQGYHDLKVVFDSANVSLDWFMLSKDSDTSTAVKISDITMVRPDTSGLLIAPVVAFGHVTGYTGGSASLCNYSTDENLQPYSDAQIEKWYGVPIYQDFDRRSDRYWDNVVDELMESRAQVPLVHCRETKDFTRSLQDRDYQNGPGHFEGRWLVKFAEAVARSPQAVSSLKVGMFWENGGIADLFKTRYGYYPAWSDPALVDYVMTYHLSPWFDSIPASMLYQSIPGRPVISLFANHPDHLVNDGKMADFIASVRARLQEKYGYNPLFILPKGGDVDAAVEAQGWGQCPWGLWTGPTLTPNVFKGTGWGTLCAGGRRRLDTVWLNDWNPTTNTGTPATESPGVDNLRSRLDGSGNSVLLADLAEAKSLGMKLVQQEGFTNMAEGNSLNRSYHEGFNFPNQHIAAMREYADPTTRTAIFEAEGCDDYYKVVTDGNSGGSYRAEWYSKGNHLDVYRPLHNLQNWISKSTPSSGSLTQLSAGKFDAWGLTADGKVWARHVNGTPDTWTQVTNAPALTSVSVSKGYVWGLVGTTVYSTTTPYGWQLNENTSWTNRGTMSQISAATSKVWGVNSSGGVFNRPIDGTGSWTSVSGTMDMVAAGDTFVWGMSGSTISYTRSSPVSWVAVTNPYNITKISVGSEEVWGVNASGAVYRRNISGIGGWDLVSGPAGTLTTISVGEDYAWGLIGGTPYHIRLEGFQGAIALPPLINTGVAGNAQATLTWTTVSGANGYNIKRATTSGGPYTTVQSNFIPTTAPASYTGSGTNGTSYYYVISAITSSGETANSAEVTITPQSAVPSAPSTLTAAMDFDAGVTLGWNDNSTSESGFRIERQLGPGDFVPIAVVGKNVTSFNDASALSGLDYTYRVSAYNAAGASAYSNSALASTVIHQLNRSGWTITASASTGGVVANAVDGNPNTRWSTGTVQTGGEFFRVDMGRVNTIYQIDLMTGGGDYPKSYKLELSMDGTNWGSPITSGSGLSKITTLTFSPQAARYVRITQTGTLSAWWSINEFNIYGQPGQELNRAGWLFSASISSVFASNAGDGSTSTRWTTGASAATGQWYQADMGNARTFSEIVLDQGTSTNDYPAGYEIVVSNDGMNWSSPIAAGPGTAGAATVITFPQQTARYIRVRRTGVVGSYWSVHEFRVYGVPEALPYLSRTGWSYSASVSSGTTPASNAGDANAATRWSTGVAQANGQWFQIDMGAANTVGQLVLDQSTSTNEFPAGYQVKISADGVNWGNSIMSGVGNNGLTTINLPPQTVRYIRVTQTGTSANWWSIDEINVVGAPAQALSRTGWLASASATGSGTAAANVLDGSMSTKWNSSVNQVAGQWFQIDMGAANVFSQIVLDAGASANDYPRGYEIYVSNDGIAWGSAIATGTPSSTVSTITFPQQTKRYVRIVQTGSVGNLWTISELNFYDTPSIMPATPTGLIAAGGNSQIGLNWTDVPGATGYTIKRSTTSGGPYTTVASNISGTSFTDAGLGNGINYYYVISATNSSGNSADSAQSSTVTAPLPSPWQRADIGSVGVVGNAYYLNPSFTLLGSGADISGAADAFRYVSQTSSGDCSVVARITSQQNTDGWAKAGVMLRESSTAGSINAAIVVSPGGSLNFQWRSSTGGATSTTGGGSLSFPNVWVKLTRTGSSVAAFKSSDGVTWTQVGTTQTITMASSATIGLAVTSHNNTVTGTAVLDNVSATP